MTPQCWQKVFLLLKGPFKHSPLAHLFPSTFIITMVVAWPFLGKQGSTGPDSLGGPY